MNRVSKTFRLKPATISKLKDMAESQNTSQGRVIDNLVIKQPQKERKNEKTKC